MIVTFDGVDGAGKTTIVEHLAKSLREQGHKVLTHHFPSFEIPKTDGPQETANGYFSDMTWTFIKKINPFLEENKNGIVLIDRFKWTTFAYNLYETLRDDLETLDTWADHINSRMPKADVEFFVSVEFETSRKRKNEMTIEHFESVTDGYISAKINHKAFEFMIDGELPVEKSSALAETVIKSVMIKNLTNK